MKSQWLVVGMVVALVAGVIFVAITFIKSKDAVAPAVVTNFEECKNAGYPILESYPEQCRTPDGELFVRVIDEPIAEPDPVPSPVPSTVSFASEVTLQSADQITFSDGLTLTLIEINDSRCPADAQCIWAGELSALITTTGGNFGDSVQEIRLGTTNNPSLTLQSYIFTLVSATETAVTITVSKDNKPPVIIETRTGIIEGSVTIGPICPVEREGVPCVVPPETYTSRTVVVYAADQSTVLKQVALDTEGNYSLTVPTGTYWLQIQPAGIGPGEMKSVEVKADATSRLDFDIDTGIR